MGINSMHLAIWRLGVQEGMLWYGWEVPATGLGGSADFRKFDYLEGLFNQVNTFEDYTWTLSSSVMLHPTHQGKAISLYRVPVAVMDFSSTWDQAAMPSSCCVCEQKYFSLLLSFSIRYFITGISKVNVTSQFGIQTLKKKKSSIAGNSVNYLVTQRIHVEFENPLFLILFYHSSNQITSQSQNLMLIILIRKNMLSIFEASYYIVEN